MKPVKHKNLKTYRATFAGLKIRAFAVEQTLSGTYELEIYQARVSPELWLVRPESRHFPTQWRARSAEELMENVPGWFETQLTPWTEFTHAAPPVRPRSAGHAEPPADSSERAQAKAAPVLSRGGWVQ